MEAKRVSGRKLLSWVSCVLALSGCPTDKADVLSALEVECVPSGERAPDGAWVCPEARTVECDFASASEPHTLFVEQSETISCEDNSFSVQSQGGLTLGRHTVDVTDQSGEVVCSAELTVRDTVAPVLTARSVALWPPNHKFHSIAVADCLNVSDACDPRSVRAEFIWASSDEPVNANGDGNHEPDIQIDDCGHVSLRAERQGPENGRVYRLGVRAIDAAGNSTEGECKVIVAHDQSGKQRSGEGEAVSAVSDKKKGKPAADAGAADAGAADDAADDAADSGRTTVAVAGEEAYRIVFDGTGGNPACGADVQPPTTPGDDADAGTPDPEPLPDVEPEPEPEPEGDSDGPQ